MKDKSFNTKKAGQRKWLMLILFAVISISLMPLFSVADENQLPRESISHFHNKALELKNEGRYNEAEIIFKEILAAQPSYSNAHFDLGNVHLLQHKYAEAINDYNDALRLEVSVDNKFATDYHFNIAVCYIGLGKNSDAISHLKQYLKIDPDNLDAKKLLNLVETAYKNGHSLDMTKVER